MRIDCRWTRAAARSIIGLTLLATANAATARDITTLGRQMEDLYNRGQYDKALEIGRKLVQLAPQDPAHAYNCGCLLSLSKKKVLLPI